MFILTKENFNEVMESIIKGIRESKEIAYNSTYIHTFNQKVLYEFGYLMKELTLHHIDLLKYIKPLFKKYDLIWDETKTVENMYLKKVKEIPENLKIEISCPLLEGYVPAIYIKKSDLKKATLDEYTHIMDKEMFFYLKEGMTIYVVYNIHALNDKENYTCKIKRNKRGEIIFKGYYSMMHFIEDLLYKKVEIYLTQEDYFNIKEEMRKAFYENQVKTIEEVESKKKKKNTLQSNEGINMKEWLESFCGIVNSSY